MEDLDFGCLYRLDKFVIIISPEAIIKDKFYFSRIGIKYETEEISLEMILEGLKMNFETLSSVTFYFKNIGYYKELLEVLDKVHLDCDIYVQFDEKQNSLNDVAKVASNKTRIIGPAINYKNITTVDRENRKNLDYISTDLETLNLDSTIMSNEEFLDYVDELANEIRKYARDDKEKVLLLDKFFKKNFRYDFKIYKENRKLKDRIYTESYFAQSLLKRKKGVCAAFASLATVVLNHPKLNVETNYVSGKNFNHAWNEIKIDNVWYCFDFTYNTGNRLFISEYLFKSLDKITNRLTLIKRPGSPKVIKWLLNDVYGDFLGDSFVQKPKALEDEDLDGQIEKCSDIDFGKYSTMPKEELLKAYCGISDIDIKINIKKL